MKKLQNWVIILMIIAPAIIFLTIFFIMSGASIKEIPLLAIIGVSIVIFVSPFMFLLAKRTQRTEYDTPLQKKKRLLTVFGIYIAFSAIIITIAYYFTDDFFWMVLLLSPICVLPFIFVEYRRLSFLQKKKYMENNSVN